jgi:hypothetical protein
MIRNTNVILEMEPPKGYHGEEIEIEPDREVDRERENSRHNICIGIITIVTAVVFILFFMAVFIVDNYNNLRCHNCMITNIVKTNYTCIKKEYSDTETYPCSRNNVFCATNTGRLYNSTIYCPNECNLVEDLKIYLSNRDIIWFCPVNNDYIYGEELRNKKLFYILSVGYIISFMIFIVVLCGLLLACKPR